MSEDGKFIEVKYKKKFKEVISLETLKSTKSVATMKILQKGNRLSITPVTKKEFDAVLKLAES